jgi:sugar phosphate permease
LTIHFGNITAKVIYKPSATPAIPASNLENGLTLAAVHGRIEGAKLIYNRWRALILLAVTPVLSTSTWFSAPAIIPQLRGAWELSTASAAWLTIAVQLGFVCGALISSLLNPADVMSPRHVIFIGAFGAAIANTLLAVAGGAALGIPLRFATGFFLAGVYRPAFKLMSTWFREGRGLALGVLAAAIVVGNGMPHLVKGLGGLDC